MASGSAYPLLAIAYHEMGKADDAQAMLQASQAKMDFWLKQSLNSSDVALPIPWYDWIEFLIHYEEAQLLINGKVFPLTPLIDRHRDRAASVIAS